MLNVKKSDMTLILPVGEESLSCISDGDDADSGCLARSPDDILKSDFDDDYLNKLEMVKCSDQLKECVNNLISETSDSINTPLENNELVCSDLSSEHFQSSSENVDCIEPLVIYESKVTVNSISKFSPPPSPSRKFSEDKNPSINPCQVQKSSNSPSPSQEEIQENGVNTFKINKAVTARDVECNVLSRVITNNFESDMVNNKDSETNNTKQNNISNFLNNSIVSSEVRKIRLRKLMQRRSVSESSTSEYEANCQNNVREKHRHSFSSYENCDKLQMVLDSNFINNKDVIFKDETLKNNINKYLNSDKIIGTVNNTNKTIHNPSFEKIPRINYLEISDTLINNVKKSMIKEYQKLKKNSSLAYQTPDVNCFNEFNPKNINHDREDYSQTNNEAVKNLSLNKKEIQDQMSICKNECNKISKPETRVRTMSNHETATCIPILVENGSDFHRSHSFPVTISLANNTEKNSNICYESSPPTRLEAWKSILAEKKNSIKNHVKGIYKNSEITESEIFDNCDAKSSINIVEKDSLLNFSNDINDNQITGKKCELSSSSNRPEEQPTETSHIDVYHSNLESRTDCSENKAHNKELSNNTNVLNPNLMCTSSFNSISSKDDEKKSRRKSRLEEACHDIVHALDSIPKPQIIQNAKVDLSSEEVNESQTNVKKSIPPIIVKNNSSGNFKFDKFNDLNCASSNIASIITTIQPPKYLDIINEKSQQCPTPECCSDDESIIKNKLEDTRSISSENESDYCQTDNCGDDCDYCSGDEAEDEEDDACDACCRNYTLSPLCKHTRVITNGSLRSLRSKPFFDERGNHRLQNSRSLSFQAVLRRRHVNHHELAAIREYSVASDDQQDSEGDLSHDDSMCDLSSSWRFGLCEDQPSSSSSSTLKNDCKNKISLPLESKQFAKLKSNSLPSTSKMQSDVNMQKRPESAVLKHTFNSEDDATSFNFFSGGIHLPPRPPRLKKNRHPLLSISLPINPTLISSPLAISPRPAMGLQGLQQRPSFHKFSYSLNIPTGPKTLVPRSPVNPNPPYGFPNPPSPPGGSPGSPFQGRKSPLEITPPSPRTNSRSGALVTRNFSISDDEGGQRLSRRQVTITRHESAYREAADKGYLLTQSSSIDPYWLNWKLGVLLKTVEEVGSRLGESEKVVGTWGPFPQDQNLADQYVHNIRKFREILPDLQRGVDDVNDQAARFSAHNVPLSQANAAALHDLNSRWKILETTVNDRWRQIAGRSREVTPLTPAQLASSVSPPWERATATNKVPYYINHAQETTHWDHPLMMDLLDSLSEFNHIKFSAYRTATKLRSLQKKLSLDRAKLQMVTDVFDEHGLRGQNDRLIDVNDMIVVLSTLYGRISSDHSDVNTTLATDLCLNWLLNVYDSQRTGQMRVLSFRVGLICMCRGHLEEKYRYMFRLIADPNRLVDQRKLGLLLHDCVQVPRQLGEVAAFGGSNIEPSVRSCFTKAGKDRETIEAVHFLTWVQQEPQSLVWLAVLHRVAASEIIQHQVKCNICKTYPIVGLRYRCLKCLSFDMCQRCFFEGRSSKSHKITHPMHEYCTATTAGDEMKDFTKALKNKFKSKRSLQKHTKKGYLPVQTVLEGDPLESPSPSPSHNVTSQDMHSRLELYASRLAEVELRTNSNSTPDSEDEHGLIAQYCQSLSSTDAPFPVPKSPLQIMASVDADQKDELEQMIKDLEEENRALQAEYERLKSEQPTSSVLEDGIGQRSEAEMLAEAKLLREHKGRLEARMSILEDHNRQLEAQLQRLRQLLVEQQSGMGSPNKSSTLQTKSVTASQLAMDSPAKINGHSNQGGPGSAYEGLDQMSEYVRPPPPPVGSIAHMGNLFSRAGDLEKPVGSPVATVNRGMENDSHSDHQSDENDYDNTVSPIQTKAD